MRSGQPQRTVAWGGVIRYVRDIRHLTQSEAALALDVATKSVKNWEAGNTTPRAEHRRLIVALFEGTVPTAGIYEIDANGHNIPDKEDAA